MSKKAKNQEEFNSYTNFYPKKNDKTPYVTMWVDVSAYTVREQDPDNEWDAGDYGEELIDCGIVISNPTKNRCLGRDKSLSKEQLGFMPSKGDHVFMIIEAYGTGSTFGHTSPCFRPMKAFKTHADAKQWETSPEAERCKNTDFFGGHENFLIKEVTVE